MIQTTIEIQAPPSLVREVLLDFPSIPSWNTHGLVKHISVLSETKTSTTLVPGNRLSYESRGLSLHPTVLENSDTEFKWGGYVWGLVKVEHAWRFEESKAPENEGGTHFVQEEEFSGGLAWLTGPGHSGSTTLAWLTGPGHSGSTTKLFEGFNEDLKKRVEALKVESENGSLVRD